MDHDFLVKFAFDMFDTDNSGTIEKAEVYELITMVYGRKDVDRRARDILKVIDEDGSGTISLEEFSIMEKLARSLLFPIFNLQQQMSIKIYGESFWERQGNIRLQKAGKHDIIDLHNSLYNKKVEKKKKKSVVKILDDIYRGSMSNTTVVVKTEDHEE